MRPPIRAKHTERGLGAVVGADPIEPEGVEAYLRSRLGQHYQAVREAMAALAQMRSILTPRPMSTRPPTSSALGPT